jgi:pyruvate kinase
MGITLSPGVLGVQYLSMNRTKIVATIGPASDTEKTIAGMIKAGANVFRFNMKHGTPEWHEERIQRAQKVANELGTPVGILIDLQGPEIRIETEDKKPIIVESGEEILLSAEFVEGRKGIKVGDQKVIDALDVGDVVMIDDGFFELDVIAKDDIGLTIKARGSYAVGHRKGMNLPGIKLDLASLIADDFKRLDMAARNTIDFVALSFVRDAKDIAILREEMKKRNISAHVCAKIENQAALQNLDEIIEATDALMIARGDLGIEVPFEELAYWQKTMIHKCRTAGKAVITATQMLNSMENSVRPTRAEVSDVANAVFDGSDAVMLSGESANGKYPELAVATMRRIVNFNEDKVEVPPVMYEEELTQTETIAQAAMSIVDEDDSIGAIVVFTETGTTARLISRFRPMVPIIAVTQSSKTQEELCLSYGVVPTVMTFPKGEITSIEPLMADLVKSKLVEKGERVLFIHGQVWQEPGLTNTLSIREV